jgi:hypothetical protein
MFGLNLRRQFACATKLGTGGKIMKSILAGVCLITTVSVAQAQDVGTYRGRVDLRRIPEVSCRARTGYPARGVAPERCSPMRGSVASFAVTKPALKE